MTLDPPTFNPPTTDTWPPHLDIFGLISMKLCLENQETLIYWLYYMINPRYHAYISIFILWACFGRKIGLTATQALKSLMPLNPRKKLAYWMDLFGQQLSRNLIIKTSRSEPSPLPLNYHSPAGSEIFALSLTAIIFDRLDKSGLNILE